MIRSMTALACVGSVLVLILHGNPVVGQLNQPPAADPKVRAKSHGQGRVLPSAGSKEFASVNVAGAQPEGVLISCLLPPCEYCWLGTLFERNCPLEWFNDGGCDCACQFSDNFDCATSCSCDSACVWCWCNTTAQDDCPLSWNGDGECDCACQFTDIDCPVAGATGACCNANGNCLITSAQACSGANGAYQGDNTSCELDCSARCAAGCEFCWKDTPLEGACDPSWEGDGFCDCACQFTDPDCGPRGACCAPANGFCSSLTEATCSLYLYGVFHGVGVGCAQVNCNRCDPACDWCWMDTLGEHACLPEWAGDSDCDCACQFADPDCAAGVCGNLICEEDAASCPDDCKDLRAFAELQNCFNPGQKTPQKCFPYVYAAPDGIGLEDYVRFSDFLSGP